MSSKFFKLFLVVGIRYVLRSITFSQSSLISPTIAILPHFMFETQKVDNFYRQLTLQQPNPSQIIIISPNHFRAWSKVYESIPTHINQLCFRKSCVDTASLTTWTLVWQWIFPDNQFIRQSVHENNGSYYINDHGIGEHFQFIEKYYSWVVIKPLLVDIYNTSWIDQIITYLSGLINNQTLLLFSVDFSHHNDELIARIHDKKTEYVLGNSDNLKEFINTEVDCRPCLYISKILWTKWWLLPKLITRDDHCSFTKTDNCHDNTSRNFYLFSTWFTPPNGLIIWVVGDIIYDRWVKQTYPNSASLKRRFANYYQKSDPSLDPIYNYHRKWFGMDIVLGNMEWPVISGNYCNSDPNNFVTFQNSEIILPILQSIWVTHLMTSNNHSLDCGLGAWRRSSQIIKESGINPYGLLQTPRTSSVGTHSLRIRNTGNISTWSIRWIKYNLIWFDQTRFILDKKIQCQIISSLTGIVIITPHRGIEYQTWHNGIQESLAKYRIDCWADAIVGTHPHVTQGIDYYKNKPVVYSLGNFLFDQWFGDTGTGMAVYLDISNNNNSKIRYTMEISY